jgi:hypothetical protein
MFGWFKRLFGIQQTTDALHAFSQLNDEQMKRSMLEIENHNHQVQGRLRRKPEPTKYELHNQKINKVIKFEDIGEDTMRITKYSGYIAKSNPICDPIRMTKEDARKYWKKLKNDGYKKITEE